MSPLCLHYSTRRHLLAIWHNNGLDNPVDTQFAYGATNFVGGIAECLYCTTACRDSWKRATVRSRFICNDELIQSDPIRVPRTDIIRYGSGSQARGFAGILSSGSSPRRPPGGRRYGTVRVLYSTRTLCLPLGLACSYPYCRPPPPPPPTTSAALVQYSTVL